MNWRAAIIAALVTVPLLVVLALGFGQDPHAVPSVLPGRKAPDCALRALDGDATRLSAYRGKPVVLNFWSTWCVPCATEHHLLQQTARALGDRVQFVGVVYQDTDDNARKYLAERGSTYPQLADAGSSCAIDYGVAGVPETFFVDSQGVVAHKEAGPVSAGLLHEVLGAMLKGATP